MQVACWFEWCDKPQLPFILPVARKLVIFHQPRVGVVTWSWTHGVRKTTWSRICFPEWVTLPKWTGDIMCIYIYIYSVSSSRTVNAETLSCIFLFERHIFNAPLSMEDANVTAFFFPPLWSRGPARYLMEKYWIWCVAETVHSPVKSFWEDISKGVLNVYPATLSTAHSLCFLETCKTRFLLLLLWWWCQSSQRWEVISIFKVQVGLRCTSVSEIAQTARKSITSRVVSELHAAHEKRTCYVIVHVMMIHYKGNWLHTTCSVMSKLFVLMKSFFSFCIFSMSKISYVISPVLPVCQWRPSVLGSASHLRQLAYIRAFVINKQDFKAYYLCVESCTPFALPSVLSQSAWPSGGQDVHISRYKQVILLFGNVID